MGGAKFLPLRLVLAGLVLSAALIAAVLIHVRAVAGGTEIVVAAHGFDPRSLLRGNYTELRFAISRAAKISPPTKSPSRQWQPRWVTIVPDETTDWRVNAITIERPSNTPVGGKIVRADARFFSASEDGFADADLRYGIERVYAQQKEAEAISVVLAHARPEDETKVQVVASLGTDGRLRLKGLIVEGKRQDFGWW
jgi:uncharacterized membrane-anchored protein